MLSVSRTPLAFLIGALLSATAAAGAPATLIQFDNAGPELGVTPPGTQSFAFAGSTWKGGVVLEVDDEALASSSKTCWRVALATEVKFAAPVTDVGFFFVHDEEEAPAKAYAYAADGTPLAAVVSREKTQPGDPSNFAKLATERPIARVVFSGGYVDDFSYVSLLDLCSSTARLCVSPGSVGGTTVGVHAGAGHGARAFVVVASLERDGATVHVRAAGVLDPLGAATAELPVDVGASGATVRVLVRTARGFELLDEPLEL